MEHFQFGATFSIKWENDKRVGVGVYTAADGSKKKQEWVNGEMTREFV